MRLGHRRIAIAANDTDDGDHLDRLEAYRQTLQKCGIYDKSLEFRVPAHRLDGAQLLRKMMSLDGPTDGSVHHRSAHGGRGNQRGPQARTASVPDEFSILGFDDTESRYMVYPIMTAVCQDSRESGRVAYELLLSLCSIAREEWEASEPRRVVGKAWFEINHTTGRAPKQPSRVLPSGQRLEPAVD